jgi:hypothetical protein
LVGGQNPPTRHDEILSLRSSREKVGRDTYIS